MKHILFRIFFSIIFLILFLSFTIKGKKATFNYYTNNFINSIKVEPIQKNISFHTPLTGIGYFYLDCEPGDKILLNISLNNNLIIKKEYLSIQITFEDFTQYIFSNNNISIYDINNNIKNITLFFYIPYETYCNNKSDIIINTNNNNIISFDLQDNIFINNNKIQSLERLSINITEIFPSNIVLKKDKSYKNKIFTILPNNYNILKSPIIIKYTGVSITGGGFPLNECSLRIMYNNYLLYNNSNSIFLRKLNSNEEYYYYSDNLYNNSNALKHMETIERFFKEKINIFNLSEPIFNDLCIHIEENENDVVLDDRISLYFQNYSICNSNCVISEIDMDSYNYTCKCSDVIKLTNDNLGKLKVIDEDSFSKETISEEISDIFFETNFEVLSCFKSLLFSDNFFRNFGAIMTTLFLIIQSVAGVFLFKQIRDIRVYLYKDVIKNSNSDSNSNPPVKRGNTAIKEEIEKQIEQGSNKNNINMNNKNVKISNIKIVPNSILKDSIMDIQSKNRRRVKFENGSELSSRKALLNNGKSPKIFDSMIDEKNNNLIINSKLAKSGKINQPIKKIYPLPKNSNEYKINENEFPFFESDNSSLRKIDSKKNQEKESIYSPKHRIPRINKHSMVYLRKNYHNNFDENELKDYLYSQKTLPRKKMEENKRYMKKTKNKEQNDDKDDIEKDNYNDKDKEKEFFEIIEEKEKEFKSNKNVKLKSNNEIISISLLRNNYEKNKVLSDNHEQNTDREREKDKEKDRPKVKLRKCKTKKSGDSRRRRTDFGDKKKENKYNNTVQMYEKKDLDDDDLNELDFDEALIYDRRGFWQLCWIEMKERQLIINTFFVKEKLKPFSIKLIVFIFSITFYFVINGFLYDTKYVSKKLKRTSKSVYFFFVDSIKRIIYSSLVGALVNIVVGLLFRSDKNLRKAQNKYKENRILLNGEVVKIYKNMKITNFLFTLVNFIIMLAVWIYLFCFCGVYRNCQMDWVESAGIIIGVMQLFPIVISLLLALLRVIGLRFGIESCFRITAWISDNT